MNLRKKLSPAGPEDGFFFALTLAAGGQRIGEPGIKLADSGFGLCPATRIIDDKVGPDDFLRLRHLCRHPRPCFCFSERIALHQPLQLPLFRYPDHKHGIDPFLGAGLEKQRRFVDDHRRFPPQHRKPFFGKGGNSRVDDPVQFPARRGVSKNACAQMIAIQSARLVENPGAETRGQFRQHRRPRQNGFARQRIGADDNGAEPPEHFAYHALARGNAAGDAENHEFLLPVQGDDRLANEDAMDSSARQ